MPDENPTPDELRARGFTEAEVAKIAQVKEAGVVCPRSAPAPLDPLLAFVRARLDERERAARFVLSDYAEHEATWSVPSTGVVDIGEGSIADETILTGDGPLAEFIADNDPQFVLDDVAAKRRIVEQYELAGDGLTGEILRNCLDTPIRLLALPFAGHPEFREEWRV